MQFFFRQGAAVPAADLTLVKVGARGDSGYLTRHETCGRCNGQGGSRHWRPDGGVCYQCHGARTIAVTRRVFTARKLIALENAANRRDRVKADRAAAKVQIERLKFIKWARPRGKVIGGILMATGTNFLTDLARRLRDYMTLTDRQMEAAEKTLRDIAERKELDDASDFVSEVGVRIEFEAQVIGVYGVEGNFGPYDIVKFRDNDGNLFTWFAAGHSDLERGDRISIKGTVKDHDTYRGVKQTILTRCKYTKFETMTADEAANLEAVQ